MLVPGIVGLRLEPVSCPERDLFIFVYLLLSYSWERSRICKIEFNCIRAKASFLQCKIVPAGLQSFTFGDEFNQSIASVSCPLSFDSSMFDGFFSVRSQVPFSCRVQILMQLLH